MSDHLKPGDRVVISSDIPSEEEEGTLVEEAGGEWTIRWDDGCLTYEDEEELRRV